MLMTSQTLLDLPEMLRLAIELGVGSLKLSYLEWGYPDSPLLPSLETLQRFKEIVLPVCLEVVESSQLNGEQKDRTCAILENLLYPEHANSLENYSRGIYWGSREYCLHCNLPNSLVILYGDGSVLPCNAAEYSRRALTGNLHTDRLADMLFGAEMETYRRQRSEVCLYCPMPLHLTLPLWAEYA
jgi:hypothetical protein